jgi:hypothetical protein
MTWKVASTPLTRENKLHALQTSGFRSGSQLQALHTLTSGKVRADQSDGRIGAEEEMKEGNGREGVVRSGEV